MKFEITDEELKIFIQQYKLLGTVQDFMDKIASPAIGEPLNVFIPKFRVVLNRLIEEHNKRITAGEIQRRIKSS